MVRRTLSRFAALPGLVETLVVVPTGAIPDFNDALADLDFRIGEVSVVAGGDTRQASVRLGLEGLQSDPDLVCIHDAARPLVSKETIRDVIEAARARGAATAAMRPVDSIREDLETGETRAVDRARLWLVQTPQVFRYDVIFKAHHTAKAMQQQAADDTALVESAGQAVDVVETSGPNVKVTTPEDLELARLVLAREALEHR